MDKATIRKIVENYRTMSVSELEKRAERYRREGFEVEPHITLRDCRVRVYHDSPFATQDTKIFDEIYLRPLIASFSDIKHLEFGNREQIRIMALLDSILIAYELRFRGLVENDTFWIEFAEIIEMYS